MSTKKCGFVVLAAALATLVFAGNAWAVTLFTDDFNGVTSNGETQYGLNDNIANRELGGAVGTPGWVRSSLSSPYGIQVNSGDAGAADGLCSYTWNSGEYSTAYINYDFATNSDIATNGNFTVSAEVQPWLLGASGTFPSTAIILGEMLGAGGTAPNGKYNNTSVDLAVRIGSDGTLSLYNAGTQYGSSITFDSSPAQGKMYLVDVVVNTNSFASGSAATASVLVNGTNVTSVSFNWDADGVNYIGIGDTRVTSGSFNSSRWDNVSVSSTTVPEPCTISLLAAGLVGLLAYAWRKRK